MNDVVRSKITDLSGRKVERMWTSRVIKCLFDSMNFNASRPKVGEQRWQKKARFSFETLSRPVRFYRLFQFVGIVLAVKWVACLVSDPLKCGTPQKLHIQSTINKNYSENVKCKQNFRVRYVKTTAKKRTPPRQIRFGVEMNNTPSDDFANFVFSLAKNKSAETVAPTARFIFEFCPKSSSVRACRIYSIR